jgi:predicted MPP superfamily phosphohydrolase
LALVGVAAGPLWAAAIALFINGTLVARIVTMWAARRGPKPRRMSLLLLYPYIVWLVFCLFAPLGAAARALSLSVGLAAPTLAQVLWIAAALAAIVGVWGETFGRRPLLRRVEVEIDGLPAEHDGLRIVQLSDLHVGADTPPRRVERWIERANREEPDLAVLTGDYITSGDAWVDAAAAALGRLRGRLGQYAIMGNHDYFCDSERLAQRLSDEGLSVLRNRHETLTVNGQPLVVAGVDDTWTRRADLGQTLAGRPEGAPTLLLAHDPDLFPEAVERGVELTLSGHTHGGQVAVPFVRRLALSRVVTRFVAGLYQEGRSLLYVSRGAGTTGPPFRFGAPAEITILTLRRDRG